MSVIATGMLAEVRLYCLVYFRQTAILVHVVNSIGGPIPKAKGVIWRPTKAIAIAALKLSHGQQCSI